MHALAPQLCSQPHVAASCRETPAGPSSDYRVGSAQAQLDVGKKFLLFGKYKGFRFGEMEDRAASNYKKRLSGHMACMNPTNMDRARRFVAWRTGLSEWFHLAPGQPMV
jgi:hypothetical protein